ncbi:hypothetical protein [Phyllobacterium myrsinacearum]|uniref:Uncharacterized protein n=1 Tax=Phyllobacterium myrsinacearum TaxID=28101 RepID=A0A839EK60_9HYPH|nr:hypothetical protein [Phyllobacterium myrsinacearum]MBA8877876.1 hypothetical protein [Phyllobacterium myrsinacearum]
MHNFGKLEARPKTFDTLDGDGNVISSTTVIAMYDANGVLWQELVAQYSCAFYIALDGAGTIVSMEQDPSQSQVPGYLILGIDESFGYLPGSVAIANGVPAKSALGKLWSGSAIVARPLTREELFPPLAKWRVEAIIDLHGQQQQIDLRSQIDAAIEALPEPDRTIAKSKRVNVMEYSRTDQLFDLIGSAINISADEIDGLWSQAAAL